jgi:hypothetical protein
MKLIASKLSSALASITAIEKRGKNDKQDYSYVKAADVAQEVRRVLCEKGVAFTYDVVKSDRWEGQTRSGGVMYFCELIVKVTFTDSESGEQLSGCVIGWGADSLDKAPYKAMTGALKYALRMNFLIPDEADPENPKHEPTEDGKPTQMKPRPVLIRKDSADALKSDIIKQRMDFGKVGEILESFGYKTVYEITMEQLPSVIDNLKEIGFAPRA